MGSRKISVYLSSFLYFLSSSAAQITGGGGVGSGAMGPVNDLFAAQITTVQDLVFLIILPVVAIYGLFRYIFGKSFEMAEKRMSDRGHRRSDDMADSSAKVMAIALAFMIVIYYGNATPMIIALSAIGGILWFFSLTGYSLTDTLDRERNRTETETTTEPSEDTGTEEGGGGVDWEAIGTGIGEAAQGGAELINAVNDHNNRMHEHGLDAALDVFEPGSDDLYLFLDNFNSEVSAIRIDIDDVESEQGSFKDDVNSINELERMVTKLKSNSFSQIKSEVENDYNNPPLEYDGSHLENLVTNPSRTEISEFLEWLQKISHQLKRVRSDQETTNAALKDDMDDIMDHIGTVWKVSTFIHKLPYSLSELTSSNQKLGEVMSEARDRNILAPSVSQSELKNQLTDLEYNRSDLKNILSKLESVMEKEFKLEKSEIDSLKNILGKNEEFHNIVTIIQNYSNSGGASTYSGVMDVADEMESLLSTINSDLNHMENNMESNKFESQMYKNIKKLEQEF